MQDVPKIVTDRLRSAAPVVNHPDADVLTAFSERALPEREQAMVLEHLARCGNCRETVALALPAVEATQTVVRPALAGWPSWPSLRWGFVALGVFAIASLGIVQYRKQLTSSESTARLARSEAPVKEAKNEAPPAPVPSQTASDQEKAKLPTPPEPATPAAPKATPTKAPAQFDRLQKFTKLQAADSRAKKAIGGNLGVSLPHGPSVLQFQNGLNQNASGYQVNGNSVQSNSPGAVTPSPFAKQAPNSFMDAAAPAATMQTVEVPAQNQQLDVRGRNTQPLRLETENLKLQPTEGGQGHTTEGARDPGVVVGVSRSKMPVSSPAASGAFTGALSAPDASWTIASGGLQRSLDQGKTWQNVNVNAPPAAAANYTLAVHAARESAADTKRDKDSALKQEEVPPVFGAVAANGPDVWAGGSSGMLYHSADSGAHWTRITPSSGGAALTADIVGLDFPDALHGKITTSTAEVWLTGDGGKTWQKQ